MSELLEILNHVNSFYSNAWNNLMWLIGSTVAIMLIAIPAFIAFYQNKKINLEVTKLKSEIHSEIKTIASSNEQFRSQLHDDIASQIKFADQQVVNDVNNTLNKLVSDLSLEIHFIKAEIYLGHGNHLMLIGKLGEAVANFTHSALNFSLSHMDQDTSKAFDRICIALELFKDKCLPLDFNTAIHSIRVMQEELNAKRPDGRHVNALGKVVFKMQEVVDLYDQNYRHKNDTKHN